jgi:hypothetical protein
MLHDVESEVNRSRRLLKRSSTSVLAKEDELASPQLAFLSMIDAGLQRPVELTILMLGPHYQNQQFFIFGAGYHWKFKVLKRVPE